MKISKILLSSLSVALLSSSLLAKECVEIQSVNVGWTSYKTMAKIGVSGVFKNVQLYKSSQTQTIKSALQGTSVQLKFSNIDAKAAIKTSNILKYFASKLSSSDIKAKIIKVGDKFLDLEVVLNNKKQIIPLSYTLDGGVMQAKGVLDARDFALTSALKNLNSHVAGHKNKGWLDIDISFELIYTDRCK